VQYSGRPSYFFFQAEDGIRDFHVTGVQTCALPISFVEQRQYRSTKAAESRSASLKPSPEAHCEVRGRISIRAGDPPRDAGSVGVQARHGRRTTSETESASRARE